MASITLDNLVKAYGDTEVLHHVAGQIEDGEFIVIVGPSGCGKSTLLRMVAGLETVTAGQISIGDRVVNQLEPADRDIAMVFQNYALYPHMSVRENMAYGLKIRKISKDEIARRVEEAADILELRPYLDRKPRQLSGGQRQRVAMGRAIVRNPQVFLFDEPLSNLDAKLRVQMRLEIRKLQQRLGVTSIYVTHDQVEAMTLGDRLMVLNGGYVEQFGTPIELYDRPATTFVAGFIGSPAMNFLPATAAEGSVTLANGARIAGSGTAHGTVTLGLRPEHLLPDEGGPVRVRVELVEQLGANSLLHGQLEGTDTEMVVSMPGHMSAAADAVMAFTPTADSLHLFDPETGKRIAE
ncbi:sn-glycerol-3-phosphate import ATP-binding protein UgpC [Ruegeria pomeroyi]|uniref:sn-glycerol-3-phosphate import ATP-binding protein UgpC n=2 Tax=Ruegeria pomeroyi TaxID=89184 RepID=UGPC_RUEPO|nr:sn-glycerol-3-phosphate import ATP-binding protein UgpC [Ruegeria pomeroyi]Q5LX21.1 RecName: Full=sn-glycerol-3-phosphate import ATP-binding protein UgpC [Ruegeria pomeroyi DSS-3]HCE72428.1 sn-glycerol-3-phosphate import ATP-binding protein UgpC [Ruegeria sp.]AAV93562.1 no change [Ruegeria pomeroyi DSS-3]NVK96626.1 sn-glycerol-3-phosphate import ATP-binding protein UgpC [Ruegeria pomeroyi]NVL02212.1 sn-glycerol-3-phosphate import ATP-binding protein UgpC [Ruegeria pomeroyi]QWV10850.1 sn-gl